MNTQTSKVIKIVKKYRGFAFSNSFNEKVIIILFLFSCVILGLFFDIQFNIDSYNRAEITRSLKSIVLYGRKARVTEICFLAGVIYLIFAYTFHNKVMLLGLKVTLIKKSNILNSKEKFLLGLVSKYSAIVQLKHPPKLYIAETLFPNAFSSGFFERNSFIVLSRPMIQLLNSCELEAVISLQLSHIKLKNTRLSLATSLASNVFIIIFDTFFYGYIYGSHKVKTDNEWIKRLLSFLKTVRFILPVYTLIYRYILLPCRFFYANEVATSLLMDSSALITALTKVSNAHYDNASEMNKAYEQTPYDKIRREMYLFDSSFFNKAQTIATPFIMRPPLDEQIKHISKGEHGEIPKTLHSDVAI